MSEFFFVLKTVLFSVLVLLVLQMKIGGTTLERHSEEWIYHSRAGSEMQSVARGAIRAGHEGWDWVRLQADSRIGSRDEVSNARKTKRERQTRARIGADDLD